MNKLTYLIVMTTLFLSCTKKENLLTVTAIKESGQQTLQLNPSQDFKVISDSANVLLEPKDMNIIYSGDLKKAKSIYKNERFEIRVLLFQFYKKEANEYQVVLRSFTPDKKIIDTFILGSTKDGLNCDGYITNDLKVKKSCSNDATIMAQVDSYGKFIEN